MKKVLVLILISILVLTGCEGKEVSQEPEESMEEAFNQLEDIFDNMEKNIEESEQKSKDSAEINKVIVERYDEKMEYTLKAYRYQDEFSYTEYDEYPEDHFIQAPIEYTTDGKFLILEFNGENIGKTEVTIGKTELKALDKEDREYIPLVGLEENFNSYNKSIGPGFDIIFYSIYEVPTSFELEGLKIWENEFSNKYAIVDKSELEEVEKIFE